MNGCTQAACVTEELEAFELEISPGTVMCVPGFEGRIDDVPLFLEKRALLLLQSGTLRLPKELSEFDTDLVNRLQLGPQGSQAQVIGPGRIYHTVEQGDYYIDHKYEFEQNYQYQDRYIAVSIHIRASIYPKLQEEFVYLVNARIGDQTEAIYLSDCSVIGGQPETLSFCSDLGDGLVFTGEFARGGTPSFCLGRKAVYSKGDQERETTDYFHLGCACSHHCDSQALLMWFDTPIDQAHGVLMGFDSDFVLLDQYGQVLESISTISCQ